MPRLVIDGGWSFALEHATMSRVAAPPAPASPPQVQGAAGFAPELALLAVVLFWSISHILTKSVYAQIAPLALTFTRFALITLLAFAVLLVRGKSGTRGIRRADWPRFIVAGLSGYGLYQICYSLGLAYTSPFASALLIAMVPLFSVIILALMGEPASRRAWLGLGVAVVGVAIFLSTNRTGGGSLIGDLLSLGAAVSFAVYGIVNRPLAVRYPVETYSAYTLLTGSIPLFIVGGPSFVQQDWSRVDLMGWLTVGYTVIFPVYLAYMLWNWGIAQRGIAAATSFQLLVPISSGVLSAIFLHETFGPLKLLGAAIVLAGLLIVRSRGRPRA